MKKLSILLIAGLFCFGCQPVEEKPYPAVEFQTNNINNPVNNWCEDLFDDPVNICAVGEARLSIKGSRETALRRAEMMARTNLAKKIAELQKKIENIVLVDIEKDSSGKTKTTTTTKMQFNVTLNNLEKLTGKCIEENEFYKCYVAVQMPKETALESATASLKQDEDLYNKLIATDEYQKLIAEFK